jgi:hypothetical protein
MHSRRHTDRMNTHSPAEDAADWIAAALANVAAVAAVAALLDAAPTEAEASAMLDADEATEGYAEATVRPR